MTKPKVPVRDCDRKRAPRVSRSAAAWLLSCIAHQAALVKQSMPQILDRALRDAESFAEVLEAVKEDLEADDASSAEVWLRYWESRRRDSPPMERRLIRVGVRAPGRTTD